MAVPVNIVSSGGVAVTESTFGTPMTEGLPGRGTPVTIVSSGGVPVVFVDAAPPSIVSAIVTGDGEVLVITFSDLLDESSVPDLSDFNINDEGGGISGPPISIDIVLNVVTLGIGAPILPGDSVFLTYTPGTTPLEGLTGVEVAAFTDYPVTNP